jgi:hypothetical protein
MVLSNQPHGGQVSPSDSVATHAFTAVMANQLFSGLLGQCHIFLSKIINLALTNDLGLFLDPYLTKEHWAQSKLLFRCSQENN